MSAPIAALAIALAITIRARSSASGGRSPTFDLTTNPASSPQCSCPVVLAQFALERRRSVAPGITELARN